MNNSYKLSIIIPIYNVEAYILRCVQSLWCNNITEGIEYIFVNDCTKDNSILLLEKEISLHDGLSNQIRIFNHLENSGLSEARNTGIEHARGKYIWFIDSDDYVSDGCIEKLLSILSNNMLDVLSFGYSHVYDNGKVSPVVHLAYKDIIKRGIFYVIENKLPPAACFSIYKRGLLFNHHLRFLRGVLHEDQEFTPRVYFFAERMMCIDLNVYQYYQRQGSIMRSISSRRSESLLLVADSLYSFLLEYIKDTQKYQKDLYAVWMNKIYFIISQSLVYSNFNNNDFYHELENKEYFPIAFNKYQSIKIKFKYFLINISPKYYTKIYHGFKKM